MHDPAHFFIWLFYDNDEREHFIILSVSDFIKLMGYNFFKSMSWRKGNCRIHFSANIQNTKLKDYINRWEKLLTGGNPNTADLCIKVQEIDNNWMLNKALQLWKESNLKIIKQIPKDMMERIRRKTEIEE